MAISWKGSPCVGNPPRSSLPRPHLQKALLGQLRQTVGVGGVFRTDHQHNFRLFCPNGILLRDGRVCEDCPHHGLHCALRHRCYRGSRAQTLVVVAAYWLHRVLGTWRGIAITTPTEFDREKLLEFNKIHPTFDENRLVVKPNPVTVPTGPVTPWEERKRQFVFAGRLEELKGLRTVIEAWRILGRDAPLLLVAGDGPLADWAKAQNLQCNSSASFRGTRCTV